MNPVEVSPEVASFPKASNKMPCDSKVCKVALHDWAAGPTQELPRHGEQRKEWRRKMKNLKHET